jgi:hypothetical protein
MEGVAEPFFENGINSMLLLVACRNAFSYF